MASGAITGTVALIHQVGKQMRARNHGRILERTGAHHVVFPESAMGERVAHMVTGAMIDYIEFDDGFSIARTRAPRLAATGRTRCWRRSRETASTR